MTPESAKRTNWCTIRFWRPLGWYGQLVATTDYTDPVRVLLELVAAERPDTLPAVVELLASSPARGAFAELMTAWRAEIPDEVVAIVSKASVDLDRLERWRTVPWNYLKERLLAPNLAALSDVANQRARRTLVIRKKRRREIIARRLERLAQVDRTRRELDAWLAEPSVPVDPERLAQLLRRPRQSP